MKRKLFSLLLAVTLLTAGTAMAVSLPGLDALTTIAVSAKPTALQLPEVFSITYRTLENDVTLSRSADGSLMYINGEQALAFIKVGDDAYQKTEMTEGGGFAEVDSSLLTLDEVKEDISAVWYMIEPHQEAASQAVVAAFDANVTVLGREANRFRESIHTGSDTGYAVQTDGAAWYTFDKATGICLMMETADSDNHNEAQIIFECISLDIK